MRELLGGCCLALFLLGEACGDERPDKVFAVWERAVRETQSLFVEARVEIYNQEFDKRVTRSRQFRLVRAPAGVQASYETWELNNGEWRTPWSGLLKSGVVYHLDHNGRMASRFDLTAGGLQPFLECYFTPFVLLLDREDAQRRCAFEVIEEDQDSYFLLVVPKAGRMGDFDRGGVVVAKRPTDSIPEGFPRRLWHRQKNGDEVNVVIQSWRQNPDHALTWRFVSPEDRAGWQVVDWSLGQPSQPQ